jgi:hypothetical protein
MIRKCDFSLVRADTDPNARDEGTEHLASSGMKTADGPLNLRIVIDFGLQ